ncbi:acyltransferase family protein [Subtercola vilae]|uniref:Acyltransferase n=1 Tax=Subtercola vilae TaxID=2056433 RepID=A0A4T2BXE3_9MICO|nr:acyltransferase family protein [Subtercola vilae]TIH36623.1 acyltransferase [Subtercola vilae]
MTSESEAERASSTTAGPTATGTPAAPDARRDIQGLRALAVIAVIANHLVGWPTGGFVGVDIFFVISGFLITGILVRDRNGTGIPTETDTSHPIARFYARRVRRIVPAAATVLIATVGGAWFLFNQTRALETVWDAVASFFYTANWRFAAVGTDYFQAAGPTSPLQHFWSLSVEEQFYLVWPWLLLLLFALAPGRGRGQARTRARFVVGSVIAAIVAFSFVYAVFETAASPTTAYFSTLSRAWELAAGALLALTAPQFRKLPAAARFVLGWLGLLVLLACILLMSDTLPFPGPWAAAPVAGTLLVLAAGIGGPQGHLFLLTNPLSRFVGNISYSLYLWHFPVIVFSLQLVPVETPQNLALVAGMIVALSVVTYYLVEQPLHRSPWLEPRGTTEVRREAWQAWRDRFGAQFILATVGLIAIVVVVFAGVQMSGRGVAPLAGASGDPGLASIDPSAPGIPAEPQPSSVDPAVQLQADLSEALQATAWPSTLSPSLDDVMRTTSNDNPAKACFDIGATPDIGSCTWGDPNASKHLYLVGDSTAMAYAPAFKSIAEGSGGRWKITTIGLYGCRFTDAAVANDGDGVMAACPQRKSDIARAIVADNPQLVIVSNAYALGKSPNGAALSTSALVASTVTETAKYNVPGRLVYLAPPPLGADLNQCYSPRSSPRDCATAVDPAFTDFAAATQAALGEGDHFISSLPFSCVPAGCPAFAGTLPTKYDDVHLTTAYSEHIAAALQWQLTALGLG